MTCCPRSSIYLDTWPQKEADICPMAEERTHTFGCPQEHKEMTGHLPASTSWPEHTESLCAGEIAAWPCNKTHISSSTRFFHRVPAGLIVRHFWAEENHSSVQWQDAKILTSLENNNHHSFKHYHYDFKVDFTFSSHLISRPKLPLISCLPFSFRVSYG